MRHQNPFIIIGLMLISFQFILAEIPAKDYHAYKRACEKLNSLYLARQQSTTPVRTAGTAETVAQVKCQLSHIKKALKKDAPVTENPVYRRSQLALTPNFELLDFHLYEYYSSYYRVVARLRNMSDIYADFVKLSFAFFRNGELQATDDAYIDYETYGYAGILPYHTSFLEAYTDQVAFDSIAFAVSFDPGNRYGDIGWDQLMTLETNIIEKSWFSWKWYGQVRNQSNYSFTFPQIFACFFKDGRLIDFDYTYLDTECQAPRSVIIYLVTTAPTEEEEIWLKNCTENSIDISGWTLGDKAQPDTFKIPAGTRIRAKSTLTFQYPQLGFEIDDHDEILYLKSAVGDLIDSWTAEEDDYRLYENTTCCFDSYLNLPAEYDEIKYRFSYARYSLEGSGNISPNWPQFTELSYADTANNEIAGNLFLIDREWHPLRVQVDWGDHSAVTESTDIDCGSLATMVHTYHQPGTYFMRARAIDTDGGESSWSDSLRVTISPDPRLHIVTDTLKTAFYLKMYQDTLEAGGGMSPYRWHWVEGPLPEGMEIDSTGRLSGIPGQSGVFEVTCKVTDANVPPDTASARVVLKVINHAPVIQSPAAIQIEPLQRLEYRAVAVDPDSNTLSFQFCDYPVWLSHSDTSLYGEVPGNASDTSFCLLASDGDLTDSLVVTIDIISVQPQAETAFSGKHQNRPSGTTIPRCYCLNQNYPNPFNPHTTVVFGLPETARAKIAVFNIFGQQVAELCNRKLEAGWHEVTWDATQYAAGIYFIRMHASGFQQMKKGMLLK